MSTYRIAKDGRTAFLVLDEPMDSAPVLRSYFWPLSVDPDRVKEGPATLSRFPGGSIVHAPAAAGIRPIVEIPLDGRAQAARINERPIHCPKVRRNTETRYLSGRWESYSRKLGWTAIPEETRP